MTWRDKAREQPHRLEPDRTAVVDADSIGVVLTGLGGELAVVLFRDGRTDIDYFAGIDDSGTESAVTAGSAAAFGDVLDSYTTRVFGPTASAAA
ncbi:hypothetical protein ACFVT9_29300 [Kitasatospora cineracea]|uniref:hypothetical protein n=1 Tax=Kitasatospora cineracea TaxID=88074 RepID=UPI0036DB1C6F